MMKAYFMGQANVHSLMVVSILVNGLMVNERGVVNLVPETVCVMTANSLQTYTMVSAN